MNLTPAICTATSAEILDQEWGRIVWSASQSLGNSTTMTFGRVSLKPGHGTPRHRHPNCDEILHVLSGSVEHSLGDDHFTLHAGDTISIPTGVWHHAQVISEGGAELVICFSSADRQTEFAG